MFKGICVLLLAIGSLSASATIVYQKDYGSWHLIGDVEANSADSACVMKTSWNDGRRIQVNIFPKYPADYITMTVLNPLWNNPAWQINHAFTMNSTFQSDTYGASAVSVTAQLYEPMSIIVRDAPVAFFTGFVHSDSMTLFPGTRDEMVVDLTGTAAIAKSIEDCKSAISVPGGMNH